MSQSERNVHELDSRSLHNSSNWANESLVYFSSSPKKNDSHSLASLCAQHRWSPLLPLYSTGWGIMGSEGVGKSGICEALQELHREHWRHVHSASAQEPGDGTWFKMAFPCMLGLSRGGINGREWDILQWCYLVKSCSKATHKSNGQSDLDKLMAEMLLPV